MASRPPRRADTLHQHFARNGIPSSGGWTTSAASSAGSASITEAIREWPTTPRIALRGQYHRSQAEKERDRAVAALEQIEDVVYKARYPNG